MVLQVLSNDRGVGGVAPLDLGESSERVAEMREVESACYVVVGKPPKTLAFGRRLDHSERGIRELPDVGATPPRRIGQEDTQENQT